jgi:hypothetical protein
MVACQAERMIALVDELDRMKDIGALASGFARRSRKRGAGYLSREHSGRAVAPARKQYEPLLNLSMNQGEESTCHTNLMSTRNCVTQCAHCAILYRRILAQD